MSYHPEIPISVRGPLGDYIWTAFWSLAPGLPSVLLLSYFKSFKRTSQLLIRRTWVTLLFACSSFKNILFIVFFVCFVWYFIEFFFIVAFRVSEIWKLDICDVTFQTMKSFNKLHHVRMTVPLGSILRKMFWRHFYLEKLA